MTILMTIKVEVCETTDPNANRIVNGVYRATPGALSALRAHKDVVIAQSGPTVINLSKDDYKVVQDA